MLEFLGKLYLKHDLQIQIKELYESVAIRDFAVSMIAIFEPIYLYKVYGSLQIVFLFYAVLYFLYFFTIPLGAKAASRYGFEHCMSASVIFVILYYLTLSQLKDFPVLIVPALLLTIADKTFFRMSYHADMAHYGSKGFRGREVGGLSFLETFAGMTGPLLGGIILTVFGFKALFFTVCILALVSVLPMLSTKEKFTPQSFSYKKAMKNFFQPQGSYKRKDSLAYMGYGEELIVSSFWPIFVFLFLPAFHIIGLLTSGASVLVTFTKLYFGKLSDKFNTQEKRKWIEFDAGFYMITNLIRPFINTWMGIFSVNFFSDTLKGGIVYPFFTYVYSAAGKNKNFLEYAVFYEMSLAFGKIVIGFGVFTLSLCLVGFNFWFIMFLLAAIWSILYTLLKF